MTLFTLTWLTALAVFCYKKVEVKIEYTIEWDERDNLDRRAKGWLDNAKVTNSNGVEHKLYFYDPVRLAQDLEEVKMGKAGIIEKGLFVIKEVTKENIEKAIKQAEQEVYFD